MSDQNESNKAELEEKILELEARLVEQEHRFFSSLRNYQRYEKGDRRRRAAILALAYNFFFSSPGIAIGSTLIAIATIITLFIQTGLMSQQNAKIVEQNELIQRQINIQEQQFDTQRETELIEILFRPGRTTYLSKLKASALLEYFELCEKRHKGEVIDLTRANLSGVYIANEDFPNVNFKGANFSHANLHKVKFNGYSEGMNFDSSQLKKVVYTGINLSGSHFIKADLVDCELIGCSVFETSFENATLLRCDFTELKQAKSKRYGMNIHHARIQMPTGFTVDDFCASLGIPDDVTHDDPSFQDQVKDKCGTSRTTITPDGEIMELDLTAIDFTKIFETPIGMSIRITDTQIDTLLY